MSTGNSDCINSPTDGDFQTRIHDDIPQKAIDSLLEAGKKRFERDLYLICQRDAKQNVPWYIRSLNRWLISSPMGGPRLVRCSVDGALSSRVVVVRVVGHRYYVLCDFQ